MPSKEAIDPNRKEYFNRRLSELKQERASFDSHYMELSKFVQPRRGRFFISDRNKGDKRYNNLINSHATWCHKVARAGMTAGTMSQARPWFTLEHPDKDLMEFEPVKIWIERVVKLIRAILDDGNFYSQAPIMMGEMLQFATGVMYHDDDFESVARFYPATCGQYYIDQNDRGEIDTIVRENEWTVAQIVSKFGYEVCSTSVKTSYDAGSYSKWYPVIHVIEPNPNYEPASRFSAKRRYRSVYYEPENNGSNKDNFLRIRGYDWFPAYVPRWEVTAEDIYGTDCPAMAALGDIKQLQAEEKMKGQGLQKTVNPPLTGPARLKQQPVNSLPGGLTVYDGDDTRQKLRSIYEVQLDFQGLRLDMAEVEKRLERAFYVDMFLAISNIEGIQPRNEFDLITRNEERLLMLGPVLGNINNGFLGRVVDNIFRQAVEHDLLPPAPRELQNAELRTRFISTLAMAQRAVATGAIERTVGFASELAKGGWPQALDKIDPDQAVDEYGSAVGAPPKLVVPDRVVQQDRARARQQQEQQQALGAAEQGADIANKLGSAVKAAGAANG